MGIKSPRDGNEIEIKLTLVIGLHDERLEMNQL